MRASLAKYINVPKDFKACTTCLHGAQLIKVNVHSSVKKIGILILYKHINITSVFLSGHAESTFDECRGRQRDMRQQCKSGFIIVQFEKLTQTSPVGLWRVYPGNSDPPVVQEVRWRQYTFLHLRPPQLHHSVTSARQREPVTHRHYVTAALQLFSNLTFINFGQVSLLFARGVQFCYNH